MVFLELSIRIERPPAEVFAYLADLANLPRWTPTIREVTRTTGGPIRKGSAFRMQVQPAYLKGPLVAHSQIAEYRPPTKLVLHGHGPSGDDRTSYLLEPADGGTRLRVSLSTAPPPISPSVRSAALAVVRHEILADLERLKELLESPQGGPR